MADIEFLAQNSNLYDADVQFYQTTHEAEGAWFWWGAEEQRLVRSLLLII